MPTGLILMKGVERKNVLVINPNQQVGFMSRHDLYAINMNQERNCYSCREFEHLVRNYRN